jgi:hypothetical protein
MTAKQIELYKKLRRRLNDRGIKNIPTALKVQNFGNQKSYMLIKVLSEEVKNMNAWEYSPSFREVCFNKHGSDFNIYAKVEAEIKNVLEYVEN